VTVDKYARSVGFAVTFMDDKTYQVSTTRCRLSLTIVELRKRVADKLKIPCAVVQILHHGNYRHTLVSVSLSDSTNGRAVGTSCRL